MVESAIPAAAAEHVAAVPARGGREPPGDVPARADEYGYTIRPKLEAAQRVGADDVAKAYGALASWRAYEPEVDLYASPCYAVDLPAEDADELEVRLPLSRSCAGST